MPDAQQSKHHNKEADKFSYRDWLKVTSGVTQIITGRRGFTMPQTAKLDLCACLNLLDAEEPLPFTWDISLYTNPPELKAPRVPTDKIGSLPADKTHEQYADPEDDYDDDDLDSIARPEWNLGEVHVIKLPSAPFWTMARLTYQLSLLLTIVLGWLDYRINEMGFGWPLCKGCIHKTRRPTG